MFNKVLSKASNSLI